MAQTASRFPVQTSFFYFPRNKVYYRTVHDIFIKNPAAKHIYLNMPLASKNFPKKQMSGQFKNFVTGLGCPLGRLGCPLLPCRKSEKRRDMTKAESKFMLYTVPILCWPHSSIAIMNRKLFIMKHDPMCKYFYFAHFSQNLCQYHSGCFVNFKGRGGCQNGHKLGCPVPTPFIILNVTERNCLHFKKNYLRFNIIIVNN